MTELQPGARVRWRAQQAHTDGHDIILPAVVVRARAGLVLIRATASDGRLLFRLVSAARLEEEPSVTR